MNFVVTQEVDEENVDDSSPPDDQCSRSEFNLLHSKFEEFKRSRDQMLSKIDQESTDLNRNTSQTSSRSTSSRLPSRPSF